MRPTHAAQAGLCVFCFYYSRSIQRPDTRGQTSQKEILFTTYSLTIVHNHYLDILYHLDFRSNTMNDYKGGCLETHRCMARMKTVSCSVQKLKAKEQKLLNSGFAFSGNRNASLSRRRKSEKISGLTGVAIKRST